MFSSSDNAMVDVEYEVKSAPCIDLFDGWECLLLLCFLDMFKPTVSLIASRSHRRKVQLRRQWDGTEDNSPITAPSLPHQAQNTHWWYGVYRSLLLAGNYCSSDHHHSLFSRYFSLWKFWEDSDSCRVSVGVVVTVWLKISGKFSSLTILSPGALLNKH